MLSIVKHKPRKKIKKKSMLKVYILKAKKNDQRIKFFEIIHLIFIKQNE